MYLGENVDEDNTYFPNVSRFADMYSDIDGYGKTGYMIENKLDGVESAGATTYDAFYYASKYGMGESEVYAAPGTTSGWFLLSHWTMVGYSGEFGRCKCSF